MSSDAGRPISGPVLCGMINTQKLDGVLIHAVDDDIGEGREQEFSCSFLTSYPSTVRQLFQRTDSLINLADGGLPVMGMVGLR